MANSQATRHLNANDSHIQYQHDNKNSAKQRETVRNSANRQFRPSACLRRPARGDIYAVARDGIYISMSRGWPRRRGLSVLSDTQIIVSPTVNAPQRRYDGGNTH
ncbi:hypothetical protein [Pandoraea terrae]|uniref:hypothetical protein n=1 Tax=Pandoraea terrae TaxID=1537710 RepID=UPI0012427157|nr:hypothetical protein [Pandoraea terrae]